MNLQMTNPLDVKPLEPTGPISDKPSETDAKRPLETADALEAMQVEVAAEPEQKRMKTEDIRTENAEHKPEVK